ncbi:MAG: alkaline phosphatase family protein [Armatimonadetes bacterium]|nr:alkaline phosphatase family protein [Armatimonadota bacterium]
MTDRAPLVMLLLDSLSAEYVEREYVPFFRSLIPEGEFRSLKSLFAFDGVMATVMTGRWPDETGVFGRFAYGPRESVMRYNPLRALNLLDKQAYYASGERRDERPNAWPVKLVRKLLRRYWLDGALSNISNYARMPMALAHNFRYAMTLNKFDEMPSISGHETIYGKATRQGRKSFFHYAPLPDAQTKLEAIPDIENYALIFVHTWGHLDSSGHDFGPASAEIRAMAGQCDQQLAEFVAWLRKRVPDASFIMFADHGMHEVHTTHDVGPIVNDAISGQGPLVFVDSTAVRAWGNEGELLKLSERLSGLPGVRVLSDEDLIANHAFFPQREYGEMMAVAYPGYVFSPDFFEGPKKRLGMHGYLEDTNWLRPSLLWFGPAFDTLPSDVQLQVMPDIWRLADHALG